MTEKDHAELSIRETDGGAAINIRGKKTDLIFSWCVLTSALAKRLGISSAELLMLGASSQEKTDKLVKESTEIEIDLSQLRKEKSNG